MSRKCKEIQNLFPEYLCGDIKDNTLKAVKNHTQTCIKCRNELEELTVTWTQLGIIAEESPGPNLRKNFYNMLELHQKKADRTTFKKISDFFKFKPERNAPTNKRPILQTALAVVLLIIGFAIGNFFQFSTYSRKEISILRQENQMYRQKLTIAMLKQSSPSQRLKGLIWSSRLKNPGEEIFKTLLHTLNYDSNVNVRLSAVDALYLFADHPLVKKGLTESLKRQTSPLVQIALIDLLVELREKKAVESLRQLLKRNKINPEVKERAELSLELL